MPPWLRGKGRGLGDRRVLDAAGGDVRTQRPRGGTRQAVGSHPGDPAAHRAFAARGHRPDRDGRGADHRRLRRAPGRRRARVRRRSAVVTWPCTTLARASSRPRRSARTRSPISAARSRWASSTRSLIARPRLLGRRAGRSRHERGDDRRRSLRRGAGHRRRRAFSRGELDDLSSSLAEVGIKQIFDLQREVLAEAPAPRQP